MTRRTYRVADGAKISSTVSIPLGSTRVRFYCDRRELGTTINPEPAFEIMVFFSHNGVDWRRHAGATFAGGRHARRDGQTAIEETLEVDIPPRSVFVRAHLRALKEITTALDIEFLRSTEASKEIVR